MRKIVVLLAAILIVAGFVNVVGAGNKRKTVSLQTFVNSVAGRTEEYIVARFGKPSCQGHYIFLGMVYDNFVKDERTGEVFSVQVLFKIGIPAGTVKKREGKWAIGKSNLDFVASTINCPYYTFEVKDAGDPVVQNYNIYVRPWRATSLFPMNTQPIPSCEELNRENDRINRQRDREKTKQEEREKERTKEEAPLKSAVEKLIGKQITGLSVQGWLITDVSPHWRGEAFITNEGEKYVLVPGRKRKEPSRGNLPWRDPHDSCPECNVFEFFLIEDRHKDGVDYVIFECEINCEKREVFITILLCKTGTNYPKGRAGPFPQVQYGGNQGEVFRYKTVEWENYAENCPIDLIASKLKGRSTNSSKIDNSKDKKIVTVTWTFANIRSGPGNDHPIVTSVNQGDKLIVIGESGEWLNVRLEDGKQGWISGRLVK